MRDGIAPQTDVVPFVPVGRLYNNMSNATDTQISDLRLLDVDQVADRLGVTPRFIRRLVDERRIPFCKIGKFVRFDAIEVAAWVDGCRVEARR